jgi:Ca-activated chloride channel family protein
MIFTVRADRRLVRPSVRSDRYALAHVEAPVRSTPTARPAVTVALVLDRSGSMADAKLTLARRAVEQALRGLEPRDRFSLVVYDDRIDVLVESTAASAEAKKLALSRLAAVEARGSTNLTEGWLRGCEQVGAALEPDVVGRVLLLTDGLANVGITDPAEIEHHAEELRRRSVATTTFGVGADFDERLLQAMARAGGGHFYFIATPAHIPDYLASELGEALEVTAREAVLEVETTAGMVIEPLSGHTAEQAAPGVLRVHLGDLVSGQELDVVLRLNFPRGAAGESAAATFCVRDRDGALPGRTERLVFDYADHRTNDLQPRERDVDRVVANMYAARVRQEAIALNRRGDFRAASQALLAVARRIRTYAGDDPDMNDLVRRLEREAQEFSVDMPEMSRKTMFFASANVAMMRSPEGRARRTDR